MVSAEAEFLLLPCGFPADLIKPLPGDIVIGHEFRRRIDADILQFFQAALGLYVKSADRVDLVSPQLDPDRILLRQRKKVKNSSPAGILSGLLHLVGALIADPSQIFPLLVQIQLVSHRERTDRVHPALSRHAVAHQGAHGQDHRQLALRRRKRFHNLHSLRGQMPALHVRLKKKKVSGRI